MRDLRTALRNLCRYAVFAFLVVALVYGANAGKSGRPFSLSIRPLQDSIKVGSPIPVQVVLRNTAQHEIGILRSIPEADYTVEVRDLNGHLAPDTDFGRKQKDPATVKVSTATPLYTLKPGESVRDDIDIDKLYQITSPGKYSIRVSRVVPDELGGGVVDSNTVTVTVTP